MQRCHSDSRYWAQYRNDRTLFSIFSLIYFICYILILIIYYLSILAHLSGDCSSEHKAMTFMEAFRWHQSDRHLHYRIIFEKK